MLYQIIIVIHILLGIGIIGLVLIQHGKGADAGAAFGSGASGSVFGAQGSASFLSRTTAIFAGLFFVTSLSLAFLSGYHAKKTDLIDTISVDQTKSDVPLTPVKAGTDAAPAPEAAALPETALPAAPALKQVEQAPVEQPKAN